MDQRRYSFGQFVLDADRAVLTRSGAPVVVGTRAFALLRVLLEAGVLALSMGPELLTESAGYLLEAGRRPSVPALTDALLAALALVRERQGRMAEADAVAADPELELVTQDLSITTFRYVPADLRANSSQAARDYVDDLNRALLDALQHGGEVFVSNAVIAGRYVLRACIVNFHTTLADVQAVPGIVVRTGQGLDVRLRVQGLR